MRGPGEDWKARALAAEVSRDTLGDRLLEAQATIARVREFADRLEGAEGFGSTTLKRVAADLLAELNPTTEGSD